ncbi:DUF308 domain-containing protein [Dactylosporangium aurantiacum]|uniref:DUF308 domain-containing protein n=1 Tax=Dactylosporangium aurantiacum TaxID=35754 RepID=A0A9Q9MN50_9ACTN|nr:DUF308 domain-containing protein [Dactylosporangium aurantiacum]MDG6103910.1 DUF308 domain-containing protein [Dactylosporangium aurantiacum]UWZ58901.1 DUF308 domain-containing protein [Dactylosporangium aurantiacum]
MTAIFGHHHHDDPHHAAGRPAKSATGITAVSPRHLLALGAITVVFGIAVLIWPAATLRLLGVLAGIWLIATGATRIIHALRRDRDGHGLTDQVLSGVLGVVLIIGGVACISRTASGVTAVAVILGLAWLLSGVTAVLLGLFARGSTRWWLLGIGAASIVVGLLFLSWPDLSPRSLVLLTGITALILGTGELSFGWQQRHQLR